MDNKKKIKILSIVAAVLLILNILLISMLPDNDAPVEITFWGFWEEEEAMHPLIEKYQDENPGVTIKYAIQPLKDYETILYGRLEQSDTSTLPAPDIAMIHNNWLPKFEKYLSPLPSSVMDEETYSKEFYPTAINDFTGRDGNIYAIPLQIDGLMVIYNKEILLKAGYSTPPSDWDSFMELAKDLTERDNNGKITKSGLAIGTANNITHSTDILSYFFVQNLVQLMNEDKTEIQLTSDRAIRAFDTYTSFVQEEDATWATYLPSDLTSFVNGDLAMMFGTSWRALDILSKTENIEFGLAPLPRLPNNEEAYYSTYWGTTVSKSSDYSDEAWKFIEFLSQPEQLRRLNQNAAKIRAFGEPYSRVSMNEELKENEYTQAIGYMAPYMKSWQIGDQTTVDNFLQDAITKVVEEEQESESVLRSTQEEINIKLAESNK
ncbi:MAG TPA: sugar ABC transporter substrate-binding protein [Candidatus Dojkabacteria bacterium]|nr:sugar ABC transporter substrate-binding protein [Candidatus Dojkabacteria bacterium]